MQSRFDYDSKTGNIYYKISIRGRAIGNIAGCMDIRGYTI